MSNVGSIPQIPAGTTIQIVTNADWLDQFYVQQPGYPASPITAVPATLNGTVTVVLNGPSGVSTGMLVVGHGILPGTQVSAIASDNVTVTLNQAATLSGTNVPLSFYGPPLDLTGIRFKSMLRPSLQSTTVLLIASTDNGLMTNGLTGGTFGWNVPAAKLPTFPIGVTGVGMLSCACDIQAIDISTGQTINLCAQSGPIPVTVALPETR